LVNSTQNQTKKCRKNDSTNLKSISNIKSD
jgi:hypothetical protein